MLTEYLKYWGLSKPPFSLTPDPDMLYLSKQHREGLIRLRYAVVSNKGGALLISENAGDGKTSLLAKLRQELDLQYQGHCRVVFIDHPTLTANQMVMEIARQLGVEIHTNDKLALLNDLRRFLLECHSNSEKCVVMLDEGQMLCHRPDLLQELRILLNFCVSDAFLLTFLLSGQKPLDEAVRAMPEFYQRLPVRFFLRNLNREDTREMIRHRLKIAGNPPSREIFSEDGYTGIYNFSKGCPRIICSVADLALVIAHTRFSREVDFVAVSQACSDMSRTDGAYHYYYFLQSFKEELSEQEAEAPFPPAQPGYAPTQMIRPEEILAEPIPQEKSPVEPEKTKQNSDTQVYPDEAVAGNLKSDGILAGLPRDSETSGELALKKCPHCSGEVTVTAKFCGHCGMRLEKEISRSEDLEGSPDELSLPHGEKMHPSPAEAVTIDKREREEKNPDNSLAGSIPPVGELKFLLNGNEEEKILPPDKVKCPFCSLILDRELRECPNCGEKLQDQEENGQFSAQSSILAGSLSENKEMEDSLPESLSDQNLGIKEGEARPSEWSGCPACGAKREKADYTFCRKCGSPMKGDSYEEDLLGHIEQLSLRKYILSKNYLEYGRTPDPLGEELLFFPLGRFCGSSAVLRFSDGGAQESFTTRCGLIFTSSKIRFVFTDGLRDLNYGFIDGIAVEELKKNGSTLLYNLLLSTKSGSYRIVLPFQPVIAKRLSRLLRRYICAKVKALAYVQAGNKQDEPEQEQKYDITGEQ